jgi:stage V sporulation protein B
MTNLNYPKEVISLQYGLLESYAIPVLFLPGFFASALSTYLLPNMSSLIAKKEYKKAKKLLIYISTISLSIGTISALISFIFPELLLTFLYGNSEAKEYVKTLALPFIIYYVEAPLSTAMYALSKEKESLIICIISSIFRVISLFVFIPKYGALGTAFSTLVEVIIIVLLSLYLIVRFFKNDKKIIFINK